MFIYRIYNSSVLIHVIQQKLQYNLIVIVSDESSVSTSVWFQTNIQMSSSHVKMSR